MWSRALLRILPGAVVGAVLLALLAVAPGVVARFVTEDGVVEWLQVGLAVVALGFVALAATRRRLLPGDMLLGALFASLASSEIDLDRRIFGLAIVDWKFFRRPAVPLPLRVLAAAVLLGALAALLAYAALRWRALAVEAAAAFRDGWASLFIAGLVLFAIPQPCERCLNHVSPLFPLYFLEETLELLGCLYFTLAMAVRAHGRA